MLTPGQGRAFKLIEEKRTSVERTIFYFLFQILFVFGYIMTLLLYSFKKKSLVSPVYLAIKKKRFLSPLNIEGKNEGKIKNVKRKKKKKKDQWFCSRIQRL